MKYALYEDPRTHLFTYLRLPPRFVEGDPLPEADKDCWFASHGEAVAAVAQLLDRDDG